MIHALRFSRDRAWAWFLVATGILMGLYLFFPPLAGNGPLINALGHELGHAFGGKHILALKGDAQCESNENLERCYGETPEERANIMGKGDQITRINAKPWQEHLMLALGPDGRRFTLSLMADPKARPRPPRPIPVAPAHGLPSIPSFASRRFQPVGMGRR